MSPTRSRRRPEGGAVALLVAVLSLVLFASLAFAVDLGMAYANQRRIQAGTDAAALAVARSIAANAAPSDTCSTIRSSYNGSSTRAIANNIFAKNVSPGATLASGANGFEVTCESIGSNPSTVVVKVAGSQSSPSFVSGLLGRNGITVGKTSRSIVGPLGSVVGLRPFGICETFADQVQGNPGQTFVVPVTQANAGCGTAPGNWALLDFNGGSNPTSESADWTANGYQYPISTDPPVQINGDPGFNVNAFTDEMNTMFSLHDVVLPVYDSVTGSGNNSVYHIVAFISVTPCRYKINNKTGPSTVNTGCAALPASPPSDYIQLMYSTYVPIGSVSDSCSFGTDFCDDGPRGTALAD